MLTSIKKQIRVTILAENFSTGGVQKVSVAVANSLAEKNCEVTYLALRNSGQLHSRLSEDVRRASLSKQFPLTAAVRAGISDPDLLRWTLDKRFRKAFYFASSLAHYLKSENPDLVLAGDMRTNSVAVLARAISGVKTRIVGSLGSHCIALAEDPRSANKHSDGLERPWPRALSRDCLSRMDRIVTVSRALQLEVSAMLSSPGSVKTIYNPIVSESLRKQAQQPAGHHWFQDDRTPIIMGMGRISPIKDFETLLRAFALCRKKRACRLVLLGYNKSASSQRAYHGKLTKLAATLGIEQDFAILPATDNPYPYLNKASVFALSSLTEGFGNVLVEALFLGVPVVSTDCPSGPREILEDGRYGALLPVGSPQAMSDAIEKVLDNEQDQTAHIARAQQFSLQSAGENYFALIQSLTDNNT